MEDGFAAFAQLKTEAELRSTFVVECPGKKGHWPVQMGARCREMQKN